MSMSVLTILTTVNTSVLTHVAPSPVPATMTSHSQLMDGHVNVEPILLQEGVSSTRQVGPMAIHKEIFNVNG